MRYGTCGCQRQSWLTIGYTVKAGAPPWMFWKRCPWLSQDGAEELRYTPVPEAFIGDNVMQAAIRRIQDIAIRLALRSAATLHTFVQVRIVSAMHMWIYFFGGTDDIRLCTATGRPPIVGPYGLRWAKSDATHGHI